MWYCYVTELYAYDFVINEFVIKRGIICAGPCIFSLCHVIHLKSGDVRDFLQSPRSQHLVEQGLRNWVWLLQSHLLFSLNTLYCCSYKEHWTRNQKKWELKSYSCSLLAVWLLETHFTFLGFSFLICKLWWITAVLVFPLVFLIVLTQRIFSSFINLK